MAGPAHTGLSFAEFGRGTLRRILDNAASSLHSRYGKHLSGHRWEVVQKEARRDVGASAGQWLGAGCDDGTGGSDGVDGLWTQVEVKWTDLLEGGFRRKR